MHLKNKYSTAHFFYSSFVCFSTLSQKTSVIKTTRYRDSRKGLMRSGSRRLHYCPPYIKLIMKSLCTALPSFFPTAAVN